jgi:hypothetical protein
MEPVGTSLHAVTDYLIFARINVHVNEDTSAQISALRYISAVY